MADQSKSQEAPTDSASAETPAAPPLSRVGKKHIHVKPNMMFYTDGQGVKHEIYIPRGQNEEVTRLYVNEDWEALAKYPKWSEFMRTWN